MPDTDPDCLFCKIVAGELPSQRVDEDEHTVAFMDIAPATRGHALVIRAATPPTCSRSTPPISLPPRRPLSGWPGAPSRRSAPTAST